MKETKTRTKSNGSKCGPRTKAGKDKSRLNALTHGLYAKAKGSGSRHQRLRDRIYRKIYAKLSAELLPVNEIEGQHVETAADALVRKALVLGFENDRIDYEFERPLRALKEIQTEIAHQRQLEAELEADLARLEAEKHSGLQWEAAGGVRDSFLAGLVSSQSGEEIAATFQSLSTAGERKAFFYGVVKLDEATVWNHLDVVMKRTREAHATKAEELTSQMERGLNNGEYKLSERGVPMPSKDDMEFILDAVNKCNRQFTRAIDALMRYREARSGAERKGRSARLDQPSE